MRKTSALRQMMFGRPGLIRVAGANDGLSAILAERCGFDALWASGLAISASHGVPDTSILTMTDFLAAAAVMNEASGLPVIADCDTGFGGVNNVVRMVRQYERTGIAAVCIEDKNFPKRNSFLPGQVLADPHEFAARIAAAKRAQTDPDFMVIARLESLIANQGLENALFRGRLYSEAGADAILIHSKAKTFDEIRAFSARWHLEGPKKPLVVVPTTYYSVTRAELESCGIQMAIYANQALRAAITAMTQALGSIIAEGTSAPIEGQIAPLKHVFSLIGTDDADAMEQWYENELNKVAAAAAVQS